MDWFALFQHWVDPDLGYSRTERRAIRLEAEKRLPLWQSLALSVLLDVGSMVAAAALLLALFGLVPWTMLTGAIIGAAMLVATLTSISLLARRWIRPRVREVLAERGVSICVTCGYRLEDARSEPCSECGTRRVAA